ncbi:MAG: glucosamine-6-phosphate deaminase, partial [Thermoanaerobaculia bacterium]
MPTWTVVDDYAALAREASRMLLEAVDGQPKSVLLLPTGTTPEGMYQDVVVACRSRYHCFRDVTTFNLDEYVGIRRDHPGSYWTYMQTRLFRHIDLDPERTHVPDGLALGVREDRPELPLDEALAIECARYESSIAEAGGIDVTFLGLGRNGHIGFNEPGSPLDSRTRVVRLHDSTRQANAPFFEGEPVPGRAITVGIGTILESRSIVLMASGPAKREAIARLASGERSPDFPASALLGHEDVTIIV